jgi:hypothetical protein
MNLTIEKIQERTYSPRSLGSNRYDRIYTEAVVYVDFGESVWEHLENRRTRPYNQLKPLIANELRKNHITFTKIRWNRYAGCSMCPCSGGFIIEGGFTGHDIWMNATKD